MTELESLKLYLSSPESAPKPSDEVIRSLAARCEWFAPVRILLEASSGEPDAVLSVTAPWREESSLRLRGIDVGALVRLTSEEVIDRFLREEDLRIVADEHAPEEEVRTEPDLDEEDEVVSEELAEIYLSQGLRDKDGSDLSQIKLLNPEKSVYFVRVNSQNRKTIIKFKAICYTRFALP